MNKLNFLGVLLPCLMIGCVSATVDEPSVCTTVSLGSIPASPFPGITLPPTSFSDSMDFSGAVSKLTDVASNLTANVSNLSMSNNGDLDWMSEVNVSIASSDMPSAAFASYTAPTNGKPGTTVDMKILMDSSTLLKYLEHPITLTFTVSGTAPTQSVTFMNTMCVAVSGKFSKSL